MKNPYFSYFETEFTPEYEKSIRRLTRDPDPAREIRNLPQDRLLYAFVTYGQTTGIASEFGWASGRKDVQVIVDFVYENCSEEVIAARGALIEELKEKYHDRGFAHEHYEGGAQDFARNYQHATGRIAGSVVAFYADSRRHAA